MNTSRKKRKRHLHVDQHLGPTAHSRHFHRCPSPPGSHSRKWLCTELGRKQIQLIMHKCIFVRGEGEGGGIISNTASGRSGPGVEGFLTNQFFALDVCLFVLFVFWEHCLSSLLCLFVCCCFENLFKVLGLGDCLLHHHASCGRLDFWHIVVIWAAVS